MTAQKRQERKTKKLISIVVPVHNEAKNAPLLYKEVTDHVKNLPYSFEFIYVDDGSKDFSSEAVEHLVARHPNVKLIQLSRNFGKEAAVTAGLHAAKGDAAMVMDADLQHPPRLIGEFIQKWEAGKDVIVGVRKSSPSESWFKRFTSDLFYKLITPVSNTDLIPHATDFRLMDRKVVDAFCVLSERNRMTRGLIDWLGFNRDFVYFIADERAFGERSYSYKKLVELAINSFTSYTMVPLRFAGYLGAATMAVAGPLSALLYVETFLMRDPFGWNISNITMLTLFMTFLIGIVLGCLGLVAMYIARIHHEVSGRPLYVVRKEVVSRDADETNNFAESAERKIQERMAVVES